jgi:hypothetical protein
MTIESVHGRQRIPKADAMSGLSFEHLLGEPADCKFKGWCFRGDLRPEGVYVRDAPAFSCTAYGNAIVCHYFMRANPQDFHRSGGVGRRREPRPVMLPLSRRVALGAPRLACQTTVFRVNYELRGFSIRKTTRVTTAGQY